MNHLFTLFISLLSLSLAAQETNPFAKFGSVQAAHLSNKFYKIDSSAGAVVLSDLGYTSIEGNSKGWFSLVIRRHKVIHILDQKSYDEADIEIPLYRERGAAEKLENIRAVTYNLRNGKVHQSKLQKSGIYTEQVNKTLQVKKILMPAVKKGSIIEIEYEISSDFINNLDPWYFQGTLPVLWSEYQLSLPRFFSYGIISYGYQDYFINQKKERGASFIVLKEEGVAGQRFHFSTLVTDYRWVQKNIPAIRSGEFTSAIKNHIARLEFQLSAHNAPLTPKTFINTWPALTESLLSSEQFGDPADPVHNWLGPEVKRLIPVAVSPGDSAEAVFRFVRDQFTCTSYSALWREQSYRQVWKSRNGSVAEINLLLAVLLNQAGMKAEPVILSTTGNGYVQEAFPMITAFNYVICRLSLNGDTFYLDASRPRLGFGKLLPECYNGHARVVNDEGTAVYLNASDFSESRRTTAIILPGMAGEEWTVRLKIVPGYHESYLWRMRLLEQGRESFTTELARQYGMDAVIEDLVIDSLVQYESPLKFEFTLKMKPGNEDLLYINPLFGERYKINPFQSAKRNYPVEIPYALDETFLLTLPVPEGYEPEFIPRPLIAKIDSAGKNIFEYLVTWSGNTISLQSKIKISQTVFQPGEYDALKNFFDLVVDKQNERIVFRKVR